MYVFVPCLLRDSENEELIDGRNDAAKRLSGDKKGGNARIGKT